MHTLLSIISQVADPEVKYCSKRILNSSIQYYLLQFYMLHDQGPVVQSVLSLTSSLRVISLTVLADSICNILIFFAEKM